MHTASPSIAYDKSASSTPSVTPMRCYVTVKQPHMGKVKVPFSPSYLYLNRVITAAKQKAKPNIATITLGKKHYDGGN